MRKVELKYNDLSRWRWNSDKQAHVSVDGVSIGTFVGMRPNELMKLIRQKLGVKRVKSTVSQLER